MKHSIRAALMAAAGLMVLPLASCEKQVVDEGQIIIIWSTFNDDYQAIIKRAAQNFHKKYPEYSVKVVKQSGSYDDLKDKVVKGIAGGTYPDLTIAYPDSVAEFLNTGKGLDISTYMNDATIGWTLEDRDDIPAAYIEEGQNYSLPGTYSLPICKSTEALFYNRDVLVGLDLSGVDDEINNGLPLTDDYLSKLTWEELFGKLCPAIAEYDSNLPADKKIVSGKYPSKYNETGAIVGYDSDDNFFITLAQQYGLPYTSINQTTGIGSVDFVIKEGGRFKDVSPEYMDLMKTINLATQNHAFNGSSYKYLTTSAIMGDRTNYCFVGSNGGMLFSIGSTGGTKYQDASSGGKFDVGVTYLPYAEGRARKSINQGPSVAFLKRGKTSEIEQRHAKGAWLFYKEWTSTEMNISWSTVTGYAPIRTSVTHSPEYLRYASEEGKTKGTKAILDARNAKLVADNIDNLYSSPVFAGSAKARSAVSAIFSDIRKGALMPQDGEADYAAKEAAFEDKVKEIFSKAFSNAIK